MDEDARSSSAATVLHAIQHGAEFGSLSPERVAVEDDRRAVSYGQLMATVAAVAAGLDDLQLMTRGSSKQPWVGLFMPRSADLVPALLGILESGAAFVPMDTSLPLERLQAAAEDAEVAAFVTHSSLLGSELLAGAKVLCMDRLDQPLLNLEASPGALAGRVSPRDVCYVTYTSGSTGRQKGVVVEHLSVANVLTTMARRIGIAADDTMLAVSTISFDISVLELLLPLCVGARVHVCSRDVAADPERLINLMETSQATVMQATPTTWSMLVQAGWQASGGFQVLCGGESMPIWLARKLTEKDETKVWNLYGPTEATIWCSAELVTMRRCESADGVPIGAAFDRTQLHVLDEQMQLVDPGESGELYISGVGVARGYWKLPELSGRSFMQLAGQRAFRTGDIVRRSTDGHSIVFVGRKDDQVKVNGFRIELGEIEAALLQLPCIGNAAAATTRDVETGFGTLVAFVVPASGFTAEQIATENIRDALQRVLPTYMVPSRIVAKRELPVLPNGKLNRRLLLEEFTSQPAHPKKCFSADSNKLSQQTRLQILCDIWAGVLNLADTHGDHNVFDLGADSVRCFRAVLLAREAMVPFTLTQVLESKSVLELELVSRPLANNLLQNSQSDGIALHADHFKPFPLTEIQHAYWVGRDANYQLGNVSTHEYYEFTLPSQQDIQVVDRLEQALRKVIGRHDMLRAVVQADGEQVILQKVSAFNITRIITTDDTNLRAHQMAVRKQMSHQIFDTASWPLFGVTVVLCKGDNGELKSGSLHFGIDLIIADARSLMIMFDEWREYYCNMEEAALPELETSFRAFALQHGRCSSTKPLSPYWANRLRSLPPRPELPLRHEYLTSTPRFNRRRWVLRKEDWFFIKEIAQSNRISPACVLCCAYASVLADFSESSEFTLNVLTFMRHRAETSRVVGDFTSMTLLHCNVNALRPFNDEAHSTQKQLWADLDNQQDSGMRVLRELQKTRGSGDEALFPVIFTSMLGEFDLGSMEWIGKCGYSISQTSQAWLDNQVYENAGKLVICWDAVEQLFPQGLLDSMFERYCAEIQKLTVADSWNLSWAQRHQVRDRIPVQQVSSSQLLHSSFLRFAQTTPNALAVVSHNKSLQYRELFLRAKALAEKLRQVPACGRNKLVAVLMSKGWEQVVAVLGILMCGAAYLPIEASLPKSRVSQLLELGQVVGVVAQPDVLVIHSTVAAQYPVIFVQDDTVSSDIDTKSAVRLAELETASPLDTAYVIFTSGSTGTPKGVMIDHRGATNTVDDVNERFSVQSTDRVLALSELNFDLSVYDIFGLLSVGGAVVIPKKGSSRDPGYLLQEISRCRVTVWNSVPALMEMLVEFTGARLGPVHLPQTLRLILMSGDWIPLSLPGRVKQQLPAAKVISLGGATEASIWSIMYEINEVNPGWTSIPYGQALRNQTTCVLSDQLQPRPVWAVGEIHIGGVGVAQGYLLNEKLSRERFITLATGERVYKTGDLGRLLPDGNIEILGRLDFQVKVGGYRIELGEIEAAVSAHRKVQKVVIAAPVSSEKRRRLVGYVIPVDGATLDSAALETFLKDRLPEYMVPTQFLFVDHIPLTANGKVDGKALELIQSATSSRPVKTLHDEAVPMGWIENLVLELCREVLGKDVAVEDDLLEAGLDSVMAIKLAASACQKGARFSLRQVLQQRSVRKICNCISGSVAEEFRIHESVDIPDISSSYTGRPDPSAPFDLTDIQQAYLIGRSDAFDMGSVAAHTYKEFSNTSFDVDKLQRSLNQMVSRHAALRLVFDSVTLTQRVLPPHETIYQIPVINLNAEDVERSEATMLQIRSEMSHQVMSPDRWPLFDIRVVQTGQGEARMFLSIDLLILDARSVNFFFQEWRELYENIGESQATTPLNRNEGFDFDDYCVSVVGLHLEGRFSKSREYWSRRISSLPPGPVLPENPSSLSPPGSKSPRFVRHTAVLSEDVWAGLQNTCRTRGVTASSAICASFLLMLAAWSTSPSFCINATIFNRLEVHSAVKKMFGDFTSTVLLEKPCHKSRSFLQFCVDVQEQMWEDLQHRHMSGIEVLRNLGMARGQGGVMIPVVFTSALEFDSDAMNWLGTYDYGVSQTPQVNLDCQVFRRGKTIVINFDVLAAVFPAGLIDQMQERLILHLKSLSGGTQSNWDCDAAQSSGSAVDRSMYVYSSSAPAPAQSRKERPTETARETAIVRSRDRLSAQVRDMWTELLPNCAAENIVDTSNWFTMGGDSVSIIKGASYLMSRGIPVSLSDLFYNPVFGDLVDALLCMTAAPVFPKISNIVHVEADRYNRFAMTAIQKAYVIGRSGALSRSQVSAHDYTEFDGMRLDLVRLSKSFQVVVSRHDSLRTILHKGDMSQQVLATVPLYQICEEDLSSLSAAEQDKRLQKTRARMSHQIIDISAWPSWEICASKLSDGSHRLHVSIDLTFIDIQSMGMLFEEWRQAYDHCELSRLPEFTFRDYVVTENELRSSGAFQASREYWLQRLDTLPVAPKLPIKQATSRISNPAFHRIKSTIDAKTWTSLEAQANQLEVTPSVVLLSSFARVVGLWSADSGFSINCTIFDRMLPAANALLGDFTSTVMLAVLDSDQPVRTLLKQVQMQLVRDLDHRFMSGVEVAQELRRNTENGTAMLPIVFTSALDFDSGCMQWLGREGFGISQTPNCFLDCQIYRANGDVCLVWDYDTHMLAGDIVGAMFTAFDKTLRHFSAVCDHWLDVDAPPRPNEPCQTQLNEMTSEIPRNSTRSILPSKESLESRLLEAFATVLQIPNLNVHDDFFHNGGDSVSALRIITMCRDVASVTIDMIFTERTVAKLSKQLRQTASAQSTYVDLSEHAPDTANVHSPFPLNEIQHAYFMGRLSTFEMGNNASHSYSEFEIASIDTARLNQALNTVVQRHPMLRAVLNADGLQCILPATQVTKYKIEETFTSGAEEQDKVVVATREQMTAQQFSLEQWPLWELRVTHLGSSGLARLHFGIDLIIADARSIVLIFTELGTEYHALEDPAYSPAAVEPTFSFRDYVLASASFRNTRAYIDSENYWSTRLSNLPPAPPLPTKKSPEELRRPEFCRRRVTLTVDQWQAFKQGAQAISATPSVALCAAFADVLALWSACHHFVINTTVFNRLPFHPSVDTLVGDFTSTILLEIDYRETMGSFQSKALTVQKQLSRDLQNVFYNGVLVQRALAKKRQSQKASQFPVVFTSTIFDDSTSFESLGRYVCGISQTPQVHFDCQVYETADGLVVHWDTVDELFPSEMINDMFEAFKALVSSLCEAAEERQQWTQQQAMVPQAQHRERQPISTTLPTEQLPVKMCATLSDVNNQCIMYAAQSLTCAQLLSASDAVIQQCSSTARSTGRETCIPVIMHKGWEQIAAVFAILTMGCAYVPIDASLPAARVRAMLTQLPNFPRLIVMTQGGLRDTCRDIVGSDASVVVVEEQVACEQVDTQKTVHRMTALARQIQPNDLAYIIFTSGTTGNPKGVEIEHVSVTNLVSHFVQCYEIGAHDRIIALSSLWFDLSVFDVFAALTTGAKLVIPDYKKLTDPAYLTELLISSRVTIWNSVPTTMEMLIAYLENSHVSIDSLRLVILSGDRIATSLPGRFARVLPKARLIAAGGPTEDTVWCVKYETPSQLSPGGTTVPYGKAIPNMQAYVLSHDSCGNVVDDCPTWTTGEICFSGIGVARGYLGDESSSRFVVHPRSKERLHRTGDVGRFLPGGDIEILGREDFQVKINGFRIEVEDIESQLVEHSRVSQCAVVVQKTAGTKRLVAFWTSALPSTDGVSKDSVKLMSSTDAALFKMDQHNIRSFANETPIPLVRQPAETAVALNSARKSCRNFSGAAIPVAKLQAIMQFACGCLRTMDTPQLLSVYVLVNTPKQSSSCDVDATRTSTMRKFEMVSAKDGCMCQLLPMTCSAEADPQPAIAKFLGSTENSFATNATALVTIFANGATRSKKALITAGRIGHALMMAALEIDASIGVCPLGGLNTHALQHALGFAPTARVELLHALVLGPMTGDSASVSTVDAKGSGGDRTEANTEATKQIASIDLTSHLSCRLPKYMVPTVFCRVDALPLNLNGKIDRAKLMETVVDDNDTADTVSYPPQAGAASPIPISATERKIADIWKKVLQLPEVGTRQPFDVLTDSRNLFTRVILRRMVCDLMNRSGMTIDQATVFECNTVAELAMAVDGVGKVCSDQLPKTLGPVHATDDLSTGTFSPDQHAIESRLLSIFCDALSLRSKASLSTTDDFFLRGGDSLLAVAVTLQIRKKLKIDIPFTAIFNNPTVSSMASLLRKERLADASMVVIQQGSRETVPLFLVHPALRTTLTYNRVVEKLDKQQTVYGLEDHRPPAQRCAYTSLEQMAAHYVNAISLLIPKDKPVLLGGWSFGAVLGFEIAHQLRASGYTVPLLLMLEVAPTSAIGWFPSQLPKKFEQLEERAQIKHLMAVSMAVWYAFPTRSITGPCTVDAATLARAKSNDHRFRYMYQHLLEDVMPIDEGLVYLAQFVDDYVESEQLLLGYAPKIYDGEVVLFSGSSDQTKSSADVHLDHFSDTGPPADALTSDDPTATTSKHRGWAQFTQVGKLEVLLTPGNHDNLLLPPHVDTTSALLASVLDRHGFNSVAT